MPLDSSAARRANRRSIRRPRGAGIAARFRRPARRETPLDSPAARRRKSQLAGRHRSASSAGDLPLGSGRSAPVTAVSGSLQGLSVGTTL
jgi:hypothetical protein